MLTKQPEFLDGHTEFDGEPIVGWKALTACDRELPPCTKGCLAPGSSPHWHGTVKGYMVVTDRSILEFTVDGICNSAAVLHPIK